MNMMRYQRLSPECLPISNGRKSHHTHNSSLRPTSITTSSSGSHNHHHHHHHHHHNQNSNGSSSRNGNSIFDSTKSSQRFKPSPSILPAPPARHLPQSVRIPALPDPTNHSRHEDNGISRCEASATLDLPQWGQNKRSRGSRAENRYFVGEDSSAPAASKIQRRSITGMLDRYPPSHNNIRGSNLRSCNNVSRDSFPTAAALPNRKAEEGQQPGNGPPVRSEKRHHHHPHPKPAEEKEKEKEKEKMHKQCSTTSHYQQNHHPFSASADLLKRPSVASSEKEAAGNSMACAASEKLNLELFELPRIYLSLSRKEKEDDFLIMKGTKLSQRPKKRPKNIDRTLQYCYPGTWLSDLTRGRYEVREKKCVKKKKRGLKGMENMDSDSE